MEKQRYLLGAPVFCNYSIQNTGKQILEFSYRSPSRVLNRELEPEPSFRITDAAGHLLDDPAPAPCGGALGSTVYGSVTLPPNATHTEHWLINQWARITSPGLYHVRAERHLPLRGVDPVTQKPSEEPLGYALAIDELTFEVEAAAPSQIQAAFQPYLAALRDRKNRNPAEASLVVTTLPHPFLLSELETMAGAPAPARWDRRQALEGMARLGTPAAWGAILKIAQGKGAIPPSSRNEDVALRAYAVLLLAEKGDATYLPALLALLPSAPAELRGDLLRALGAFRDPRSYQRLFEGLHAASPSDRMNSILGLKDLGGKESLPALMAMLNDPDAQVRQVANFALEGLSGKKFGLSSQPTREDSARLAEQWHAWWQAEAATFVPVRPPACHDW